MFKPTNLQCAAKMIWSMLYMINIFLLANCRQCHRYENMECYDRQSLILWYIWWWMKVCKYQYLKKEILSLFRTIFRDLCQIGKDNFFKSCIRQIFYTPSIRRKLSAFLTFYFLNRKQVYSETWVTVTNIVIDILLLCQCAKIFSHVQYCQFVRDIFPELA